MISAEQAGLAVRPVYAPITQADLDSLQLVCASDIADPRTGKHIYRITTYVTPTETRVVVKWVNGDVSLYEVKP